jgi:hypothetical protein
MINWQYYPKSDVIPHHLTKVVDIFKKHIDSIDSSKHGLNSNGVLLVLKDDLIAAGYRVERGTKVEDRIKVPVLFGKNGKLEKWFNVDAFLDEEAGTVLEVEAGRAVTNYQFLKDLFEACLMHNVTYLTIAVRNIYRRHTDFEKVIMHFDAHFASGRLRLPLKGILIIGY